MRPKSLSLSRVSVFWRGYTDLLANVTGSDENVIVQCVATGGGFDLTHYMVFQNNSDKIYMATNTNSQPDVGETRFIFRLTGLTEAVPFGDASKTADSTETIEGSDVFVVNGETRSKVCIPT